MKKQVLLIGILAIPLCVCLSGCDQFGNMFASEKNKFVGTWQNTTIFPKTLEFSSDDTCVIGGVTGTWKVEDGILSVDLLSSGVPITYTYMFSNNERALALTLTTGNQTVLYTRQSR